MPPGQRGGAEAGVRRRVAWIWRSISDFFAEYLYFFTMDGKIEKSHGGAPPGPRGVAEAGERRRFYEKN